VRDLFIALINHGDIPCSKYLAGRIALPVGEVVLLRFAIHCQCRLPTASTVIALRAMADDGGEVGVVNAKQVLCSFVS